MSKKVNMGINPQRRNNAEDWIRSRKETSEAMKRLTLDISATLHASIKIQCARDGVKMAEAIREMLEERFGKELPKNQTSV
jgi:predicted HicB family RNase H-like nuclease